LALTPPGRLVDLAGTHFHVVETGRGRPAVILEAALGGSAIGWSLVQPEAARLTRVCSYDRAGFGWSDPGPMPRTAGRIAAELRELLRLAGVDPPFVLVGHSFGGLVIRIFARRHPAEVAGLLFVDSAHPEDWATPAPKEQVKIERGLRMCRVGRYAAYTGVTRAIGAVPGLGIAGLVRVAVRLMNRGRIPKEDAGVLAPVWKLPPDARRQLGRIWSRPAFFEALASQLDSMRTSAAEAIEASREGFGDLPLITISQTDPGEHRLRQEAALAALSSRGRHRIAKSSGHWIPIEEPQIVIDSIRDLLSPRLPA
jgi:pimeloyl-ACP methyl ester carboxylesterase